MRRTSSFRTSPLAHQRTVDILDAFSSKQGDMTAQTSIISIYLIPLILFTVFYLLRRRYLEQRSRGYLSDAVESGLTEPPSLHPIIDPMLCIGCGSCVSACPESNALGLINRKAALVNPANCIGHGACKVACPEDAIKLVFGTESRGVDIPDLTPEFQTSVPGIFVAGELGGMGLIKNAINQGRQATLNIANTLDRSGSTMADWDCVIIGCGPAGLSAALQARESGLKTIAIDRGKIGGTVAHFPRKKLVMTAPAKLPGYGNMMFREVQKEALIEFWQKVVAQFEPLLHEHETLTHIEPTSCGGFKVITDKACYSTRSVLLAIGRRGTPRTLNVPGEELTKVVYELDDPDQFSARHVLVVGGGDSAIEAAVAAAESGAASVVLSYRNSAFSRAKPKNRDRIKRLAGEGKVELAFSSQVERIDDDHVTLIENGRLRVIQNDDVVVCIGGELPTALMRGVGISISTKFGEA